MPSRPLRAAPEWDDRFARMVVVSAAAHAALIVVAIWVLARGGNERPLPLVAYTVEITDPNALGGRLPPGAPGKPLTGGPTAPPAPAPRVEPAPKVEEPKPPAPPESQPAEEKPPVAEAKPPEPKPVEPKPPEPKPEEPAVRLEEKPKPPEPKKVEPPKPEPAPQVAKPEPPKPEPKKPEPPKPEVAKAEPPKPAPAKPEPAKPEPASPGAQAPAAGKETSAPPGKEAAGRDDYAAAAERWRSRSDKQGGGLGGADVGSGPIGAGGQGPGGGGQLVGIEFLAYRQQVINTVKAQWTNVIARPGLLTVIRFEIGPDGGVTGIRVEKSSGNAAYDGSAVRAVQRANPLPAPPARYAREFGEFLIEFHSEESGGQGAG